MLTHLPPWLRNGVVIALTAAALCAAVPRLAAAPVQSHPRLLFRAEDLPTLRARMTADPAANPVWTAFNKEIVQKAVVAFNSSSTSEYRLIDPNGVPNSGDEYHDWVRTSFTDDHGVLHKEGDADWMTIPQGASDGNWGDNNSHPAVPEDDVGQDSGNVRLMTEQYAMVYALMARLLDDGKPEHTADRAMFLNMAKVSLFNVIDHACLGTDPTNTLPWRQSGFATNDRSFSQEAFPITVDLIYEDLTPLEKAKIRKAFLEWTEQANAHIYFAPYRVNGQHLPANSPELLRLNEPDQADRHSEIRLALNNHWGNHLRQMGLYGLALDPQDDVPSAFAQVADTAPNGSITSQIISPVDGSWTPVNYGALRDATGVWLYLTDYAYRHDGAGGLSVEGIEYASNGLGPVGVFMSALHTAGQDDPAVWGPQVSLKNHPQWSRAVSAYLSMLTPAPRTPVGEYNYLGAIFQPAIYGDLETFSMVNDQFIKFLAPLALTDARINGTASPTVQAVRYIQQNLAKGGPTKLADRISSTRSEKRLRDAIYYFLLFDPSPATPAAADPRPALQPLDFYAAHTVGGKEMGTYFGRTGRDATDTYFHFRTDWNQINHQRGDSLSFGLWKNGLWLTKVMTGYGILQGCSDYRNSLSLQNGTPAANQTPVGENISAAHGSQWIYSPHGDPAITARSLTPAYSYFTADATELYNHKFYTNLQEITHASRSIVWLKPDHVVVYDRASSKSDGYFKRFFLNLPENTASHGGNPTVTGHLVHATAREGATAKAELFVSALLPLGATPQLTDQASGDPGDGEDALKARMFTEAPGAPAPKDTRFLHVLQGTAAGVAMPDATQLIQSSAGTAYEGAVVGPRAVLFKKNLADSVAAVTYVVPASVVEHYITGLAPLAGYSVAQSAVAGGTSITLTADASAPLHADNGGVLTLGVVALPSVTIKSSVASVSESAGTPVTFTVSRSGDVSQSLTVALGLDPVLSAAHTADITGLPSFVTIPAGSASASFDVTPVNDGIAEGNEALVVKLAPGAAYHVDAAAETATVALLETLPASGHVQFSATNFNIAENTAAGHGTLTVTRTGGFETALAVHYSITGGTAVAATDYTTVSGDLTWAENDSAPKTIDVPVIDNAVQDGARTIAVALTSPYLAGALGSPALATLTIGDDETPGGTDFGSGNNDNNNGSPSVPLTPGEGTLQFAAAGYTVSESAGTAQLHVARTDSSVGQVSVSYYTLAYSAVGGTDYQAGGGNVTFADGETDKIISIPVYDNATPQASRYFKVALQSPGNGGVLGALVESTVTITDDDSGAPDTPPVVDVPPPPVDLPPAAPGVLAFATSAVTVSENAGSATLTVTRTGGTDGAVSVNYYTLAGSAKSGTEYGYTYGTLHWTAGDAAPKTISIPIFDDAEEEPTKSFQLTLDSPAGGATLGAAALATITILDDEVVYHVGPGQQFTSLAQVPWSSLAPGNTVRLHWQPAAYKEKLLLSARGTAAQPIKLEGVPGPNGELPVIDGTGATAAANIGYAPWYGDVMERSILAVARNASQPAATKPGYLVISNLELAMSGAQNPMPSYTKPDGSTATYYSSAGAIFLYGAEHVTIHGCVIHDTPNGIVAASGSSEATLTRDLTIDRCWLYHAGKGNSYNGSNLLTEAIGVTVQFSRLDRGLNGSNTPNVLDRSAGVIVRYNRIEGGANLLSFIEPVSAPTLIVADPSYAATHVYGNILRNGGGDYGTDGSTLIRYGGDWSSAANFRAGQLHFHHNTVVIDTQRWSTTLCNLTLAAAQVVANNNVVHRVKSGAGPCDLVNSGRTIALGRNWLTSSVTVGGTALNGTALVLTGATPGFANLATGDLHPAAASPLVDAAQPLPAGALSVDFEYLPEADGQPRVTQGIAADLGAFEAP